MTEKQKKAKRDDLHAYACINVDNNVIPIWHGNEHLVDEIIASGKPYFISAHMIPSVHSYSKRLSYEEAVAYAKITRDNYEERLV